MLFAFLQKSSPRSSSIVSRTLRHMSGRIVPKGEALGFKQLFDEDSSTYTYLLWDTASKDAIIVDPVDIQVDRDIAAVKELGLNLVYGGTYETTRRRGSSNRTFLVLIYYVTVNTHAHADHITGTYLLKQKLPGVKSVISEASGAVADVKIQPGDKISFGSRSVEARATPGHTAGCMSFVSDDQSMVLTGDALLIQGCGRTDFQGGSAETLYDSIHSQVFVLPRDTVVYPAHDYKGRTSSSIANEVDNNPRLGSAKTKDEFVDIMANLNLAYPKKIDVAVPANMRCGVPDVEQ